MYRIQLASGEEAVYRSLEEFAVGVQNGFVTDAALVFHSKTGTWLPIEAHPHFTVAKHLELPDRQTLELSTEHTEPGPRTAGKAPGRAQPVTASKPRPTAKRRQDDTASAKAPSQTSTKVFLPTPDPQERRGRAGRPSPSVSRRRRHVALSVADDVRGMVGHQWHRLGRRRSWAVAAVISGLATGGWMVVGGRTGDGADTGALMAGMEAPGPGGPTATAPNQTSAAATGVGGGTEATYAGRYREARARFFDGLASLHFNTLFAPSRLATRDSLKQARRLIAGVRNVVAMYRGDEIQIDDQFSRPGASLREPFGAARTTDSLLTAIDSLYALLETAEGRYRVSAGRVRFTDVALARQFTHQASWLEARRRLWRPGAARTPMTVGAIVAAIGYVPQARTNF